MFINSPRLIEHPEGDLPCLASDQGHPGNNILPFDRLPRTLIQSQLTRLDFVCLMVVPLELAYKACSATLKNLDAMYKLWIS